jgi:hypothetical protein
LFFLSFFFIYYSVLGNEDARERLRKDREVEREELGHEKVRHLDVLGRVSLEVANMKVGTKAA